MKKPFVALLLLVGAAAMVANMAFAQAEEGFNPNSELANAKMMQSMLKSRASRLHTSAGADPDTVWFGHSYTDHWNGSTNYWNLYTGVNYPGSSDPTNAIWDFDHSTGLSNHGIGDSLTGFWPMRRLYATTGGLTWSDVSRPWFAIDMGNQANYVMNQGPGGKRTIGVVGVWHADPGNTAGAGVMWTPLSGSKSAWCGLRQHKDNTVVDQVTNNPFNQNVLAFNGTSTSTTNPTTKHFPGYGSQMDQMLYRDLTPTAGQPLNISFLYRTRMSTGLDNAPATRTGWFHGDPLAVVAGNFISNQGTAPIDSFSVYVGAPVDDNACLYSDGVTRQVYDKQRRWFSEVIRIFEGPSVPYYEIFSTTGHQPSDTLSATPSASITIPGSYVDAIRTATGNTGGIVRLVFRVKTNRGFDDEGTAYTSLGRGAAQIDDVIVNGNNIGTFEGSEQGGTNTIDNRVTASAQTNWKSTGKPPAIYFHTAALAELTYSDLCGPADSPARFCNIYGTVLSAGNADDAEHFGSRDFASDREIFHGFFSPTINFVAGPTPNDMGLTSSIVHVSKDYLVWVDMYAGAFNLQFSGNGWMFGAAGYPARMANGADCWGDLVSMAGQFFNPEPQCFQQVILLKSRALVGTSNPSGVPDSLRFWVGHLQQCFRFAVSLGCNSAEGCYFDNISFGFCDNPGVPQASSASAINPGAIAMDIWQLYTDAFPFNETAGLPGTPAFDTTTALVKGVLNNSPSTGDVSRFDVVADSIVVRAANVSGGATAADNFTRADLVFRILPGPGNYQITAGRSYPLIPTMKLLQKPTDQTTLAVAGDASFWGQYLQTPGAFGTAGGHYGGTFWDPQTWNSARMDTTEFNIFPVTGSKPGAIGTGLLTATYQTTYHELDPKYTTLGFNKFKCFVADTNVAASNTNIICNGTVPAWLTTVPQSRTGYDGSNVTREFSKIIPDGLLTPGTHVQYFFRKQDVNAAGAPVLGPDTTTVTFQGTEGSFDAHRWQQFSVLPDRWKGMPGGDGMACMLYIDNNDRRGDEAVWASVQDSIGGTKSNRWGAYNGWHDEIGNPDDPAGFVSDNQSPGTTWDMYGVKASESLSSGAHGIGSRYANRASMGLLTDKTNMTGPTKEMLRQFYRVVTVLTGDLNSGNLGPYANRPNDDIDILNDFLINSVSGTSQPRGILVGGDGFGQAETQSGGVVASHADFLTQKLGWSLRNGSYQSVSGNTNDCADLLTTAAITANGDVYGLGNTCLWSNDLLQRNAAITEATEATFYEPVGVNAPYTASVHKPSTGGRPWVAMSEGWDILHIFGRYCETSTGRLSYYYNMLNSVFGSLCTLTGSPAVTLDVPQNDRGGKYANFMKIGNSVMRAGNASIRFGVSGTDRIKVRLYDVTGRQIRTLADRAFPAGEHSLTWDGADDSGNQVARGVYFARIEYATKGQAISGRVVVLR